MNQEPLQMFTENDMEPGSYGVTNHLKHKFRVASSTVAVKEGEAILIHWENGNNTKAVIIDINLDGDGYATITAKE